MRRFVVLVVCLAMTAAAAVRADDDFSAADAAAALRRATEFFRKHVAVHGGYVFRTSDDLTRREGEERVTPAQVWIQPPATPQIGQTYLDIYRLCGDRYYLEAARETAECLIRGQLQSGGWSELIEFDPAERRNYAYRTESAEGKGGKLRNRSTLDDGKTQSCVRLLMRLDRELEFRDAPLHEASRYALDGLVRAQYPNGAWPQRFDGPPGDAAEFPILQASYPPSWSRIYPQEKYERCYTFNDDSIADDVRVLLEAAEIYDEPRYRAAVERAGDFILAAQLPEPQPAWAQQYDVAMHPAWARKFEPPAVTGGESQGVIRVLMDLYRATGNDRYLKPIPAALGYLKRSTLPDGRLARFYELQTNKPLYFTQKYELTYDDSDLPTHYGFKVENKLERLQAEYDRLLTAGAPEKRPPASSTQSRPKELSPEAVHEAAAVAAALDARGAWVEEGRMRTYGDDAPTRRVIDSRTFVKNALTLARRAAAR